MRAVPVRRRDFGGATVVEAAFRLGGMVRKIEEGGSRRVLRVRWSVWRLID